MALRSIPPGPPAPPRPQAPPGPPPPAPGGRGGFLRFGLLLISGCLWCSLGAVLLDDLRPEALLDQLGDAHRPRGRTLGQSLKVGLRLGVDGRRRGMARVG